MLKRIRYWPVPLLIVAALLLAAQRAVAQEAPKASVASSEASARPASIYRLDFVVRELEDGKRINSRSYSLSARSLAGVARVRVGSSFNYPSGKDQVSGAFIGINIDCQPEERENGVLLRTNYESSNLVGPEKASEERGTPLAAGPIVRNVQFSAYSMVTPGKPTVIAALDVVATNRRYEIEVTATKVK